MPLERDEKEDRTPSCRPRGRKCGHLSGKRGPTATSPARGELKGGRRDGEDRGEGIHPFVRSARPPALPSILDLTIHPNELVQPDRLTGEAAARWERRDRRKRSRCYASRSVGRSVGRSVRPRDEKLPAPSAASLVAVASNGERGRDEECPGPDVIRIEVFLHFDESPTSAHARKFPHEFG